MSLLHAFDSNLRLWLSRIFLRPSTALPELAVLHLSPNFLVVNKQCDLPVYSRDADRQTVAVQIRHRFPHLADPDIHHNFRFIHRLDFSTSGVLCVALTRLAAQLGFTALDTRRSRKYYLGLLRGHVREESLRLDVDVGIDSRPEFSHRMCTGDMDYCRSPKWASSRLLVLQRGVFDGCPATKVLLRLVTGRRHQLRVHCHHHGHTIVGDYTYSDKTDVKPDRMYLHAYRLVLPTILEDIDVCTTDPFTEDGTLGEWRPEENVRSLNEKIFQEV